MSKKKKKNKSKSKSPKANSIKNSEVIIGNGIVNGNNNTVTNNLHSSNLAIGKDAKILQNEKEQINYAINLIYDEIEKISDRKNKEEAKKSVVVLEEEAKKGENADEERLNNWLDFLRDIVPDIVEVIIDVITNPIHGFSTVIRKIAKKAKREKE